MMITTLRHLLRTLPACALGSVLASGAVQAADASGWINDLHSGVRLIAAAMARVNDQQVYRAGIEIKLGPGWHTYWRYPGDAGVPPRFDFKGSLNVKAVSVLWPPPHRFSEAGLFTLGYTDHLVLPLRITPQERGKPVTLRMKMDYAVCDKLCVPVEAQAVLAITGKATAFDDSLAAAEALVPKPSTIGALGSLAIRAVRKEAGAKLARVVVDVAAPTGAKVDLFAEGPAPDWALPLPKPIAGAPAGLQRFSFELDGLPPGAKSKGAVLKLTAVSNRAAIEVTTHLD